MKKGLIMEGGAMRGLFTCGVLDIFLENGITFDGAAGISAGAVLGCNFKSHQIGRPLRYNQKYSRDPRYCSFRSLLKTGDLYGEQFCYHELPEVLDPFDNETFTNDPMAFYVGASDIETGEEAFHKCTDGRAEDLTWMRASASMPVVSRIVEIDGRKLLDGGIVCPVPYEFMESMGYDRNVIILTQPEGFVKKRSKTLPLVRVALFRYPAIVKAMEKRHHVYNLQMEEIKERELAGEALVIRPHESLGISRTEKDPAELERAYMEGRKVATERLDEIRQFLQIEEPEISER